MNRTLAVGMVGALAACGGTATSPDVPTCEQDGGLCPSSRFDAGFNAQTSLINSIGVTFSGETLGISGLPFEPVTSGDPYFVDGWNMTFSEYIFVVANVRLNPDPLKDETWQDMGSPPVAVKPGPYVMDAHRAAGFTGKDGVEPASGLFLWTQQDNGSAFDTSARYAFSYDEVKAQVPAFNVNLNDAELPDYALMVQQGWDKFIRGTATYVGTGVYTDSTDPDAGAIAQAHFAALPTTVNFAFGWNDSTSMLNCVNYDWGGSDPESDLANRGVSTNTSGTYIAQITMHTDHVFWDKLRQEGANLRFDPIAAYAPLDGGTFFLNDSPQKIATTFNDGVKLPDRAPFQTNPSPNAGPIGSDGTGDGTQVVLNVNGTTGLNGALNAFMAFSAQSQSHLNAQGLCYIVGQNAGDPYFSPAIQPVNQ